MVEASVSSNRNFWPNPFRCDDDLYRSQTFLRLFSFRDTCKQHRLYNYVRVASYWSDDYLFGLVKLIKIWIGSDLAKSVPHWLPLAKQIFTIECINDFTRWRCTSHVQCSELSAANRKCNRNVKPNRSTKYPRFANPWNCKKYLVGYSSITCCTKLLQ